LGHKKAKRSPKTRPADSAANAGLAVVTSLTPVLCLVVVLAAAAWVLEAVKDHVFSLPEYNPPVKVELTYPPGAEWVEQEQWLPLIRNSVAVPEGSRLMDEGLLEHIGSQITSSGWVRRVGRVTRGMDGTVSVSCDYRRPIAMMLTNEGQYIAIDRDGVRLPEVYDRVDSNSGWMRIIGVQCPIPPTGQPFKETDLDAMAAVRLAVLLFDQEETAARINGIDVSNFRGRLDKWQTHIKLWTRDGRMAKWGSAIGEEIEEPNAADKLRNLVLWLKKGSPQAYADLSVYRTGWIEPVGQ